MKLKQLPIVILLAMTLSGCTNTTFNKSMDAAENALANKEFEKASGLLELALQEKENDEDAKLLKNQIDELINISDAIQGIFEYMKLILCWKIYEVS